jgi:type IV secretory pathway VirJ component
VPRNWQPQFIEAFRAIVSRVPAAPPAAAAPAVRDLALVEVPAPAGVQSRDVMAILLTGDGGWSTLDRDLATGLAQAGIPTVGWSSLRYFWTPRTPESAAVDLARIIGYYATAWKVHRVVLVGYSFGADVLPFLANRLPPDLVPHVQALALLGLSDTAVFVFQVASWFGGGDAPTYPTAPEVARLPMPVLCIHGMGESDSGCTALTGAHVKSVAVGQGHHFSGDYPRLVEVIRGVVH